MCFDIKTLLISSPASKKELSRDIWKLVCQGQVRPLKSEQVRSIAKLAPHLQKIHAIIIITIIFYFILFLH